VRVQGVNIRYADWGGDGPDVLLLHGDMRTSRSWDAIAHDLAPGFHVRSMDSRGHGDSDWPETGYSFSIRAREVVEFIDLTGMRDVIGVGHSSGGAVMALAARERPELFSRLVLLEAPLVMDETNQRRIAQREHWSRTMWGSKDELSEYLRQHRLAGKWRDDVIDDVVQHEAMELPDGRIDMKWTHRMMAWAEREGDYFDLRPFIETFGKPLLVITSSEREAQFERFRSLIESAPDARMLVVENTGHNMYMERPEAVAKAIGMFVAGKTLPGRV
jgi:pimeloyl-ACP methyl ester carboxylesterase